jgi:branched-subunit amino acid ABC-type transport system permease component
MSGSQFIELFVGGLAIGCIYSLIALGFTMIIRATGVLHFAQGEVVMLGAMFGVTAHRLLPLWCRCRACCGGGYDEVLTKTNARKAP